MQVYMRLDCICTLCFAKSSWQLESIISLFWKERERERQRTSILLVNEAYSLWEKYVNYCQNSHRMHYYYYCMACTAETAVFEEERKGKCTILNWIKLSWVNN